MEPVPEVRIQQANERDVRGDGDYVLYWMVAQRRRRSNFALQRAVEWSRELGLPLVVLEPLRCGHRWASDRFHTFVLAGMRDNAGDFARGKVTYHPYVEPEPGHGSGLVEALSARAAVVVTDDWPCFFVPRMVAAAAARLDVRVEQVDSNGLLPLRVADKVFGRAFDFRRFLQRALPPHLEDVPAADPLRATLPEPVPLPRDVLRRWPAARRELLDGDAAALRELPIDHSVSPVAEVPGGPAAARAVLREFVEQRLPRYAEQRSDPDADAASGLSPYLHFGHLGAHEVFAAIAAREGWDPSRMPKRATGQRGSFGMGEAAESFLDELVTWRELGFNMAWQRDDQTEYESLPQWAMATLETHAEDPRDHVYSLEQFAAAATHDEVWNAAQRQLVREGRIHNYLRMLWGKKVLEWTARPRDAWRILVELNNRYALDGRDPNSYTGIGWVFGRYDRPWAPQRAVYGTIRYMSSQNTVRKLRLKEYLATYGE